MLSARLDPCRLDPLDRLERNFSRQVWVSTTAGARRERSGSTISYSVNECTLPSCDQLQEPASSSCTSGQLGNWMIKVTLHHRTQSNMHSLPSEFGTHRSAALLHERSVKPTYIIRHINSSERCDSRRCHIDLSKIRLVSVRSTYIQNRTAEKRRRRWHIARREDCLAGNSVFQGPCKLP